MIIQEARPCNAEMIASVLQEAAAWLASDGRALWSGADVGNERVLQDVGKGHFNVARQSDRLIGVMKLDLEDVHFWPDVAPGTSAFVHKLAVRRDWAKKGVSTALLSHARTRAQDLGLTYLRLDCVADRRGLRDLYEGFGFALHSVLLIGTSAHARYELFTAT